MSARPTWDELFARVQVEDNQIKAREVAASGLPKQLRTMHLRYGSTAGKRCGECEHCVRVHGDHAIQPFKCLTYRVSNSAATDWRLKWPACGKFVERQNTGDT